MLRQKGMKGVVGYFHLCVYVVKKVEVGFENGEQVSYSMVCVRQSAVRSDYLGLDED